MSKLSDAPTESQTQQLIRQTIKNASAPLNIENRQAREVLLSATEQGFFEQRQTKKKLVELAELLRKALEPTEESDAH